LLSGHTLRSEGQPFIRDRTTGGWCRNQYGWDGVALCSCGATSPELESNRKRKQWHATHKNELRQQAPAATPLED
jgi:hypothetical protein